MIAKPLNAVARTFFPPLRKGASLFPPLRKGRSGGVGILPYLILAGSIMFAPSARAQTLPSLADLVETLTPMVVNISTTSDEDKNQSLGSGFIIDEAGYIATNLHVIDKASVIKVTLPDNSQFEAKVIGQDKKTDIALIKIDAAKKLTPIKFGDSDAGRIGDWIVAIGNPFGLGGSVTVGIISAKSRDIEIGPYDSFIQTDASINQGSSGGPMFNMQGEVIGISTALFSTNGASQGVGFAIPSNLASWVISRLKEKGTVERGWIGVKIQAGDKGILISSITEGGPAKKAGLFAGDIIVKINNRNVTDAKNLSRIIAELKIGSKAGFDILRNSQNMHFDVDVVKMPEEENKAMEIPSEEASFNLPDLSLDVFEREAGLVINVVGKNSDAEQKGLKSGDMIIKIDKKDTFFLNDAKDFINEAKMENNRPVLLTISNGENLNFVSIKLKAKK